MIAVILSALTLVGVLVALIIHLDQPYQDELDRKALADWHNFRTAFSAEGEVK